MCVCIYIYLRNSRLKETKETLQPNAMCILSWNSRLFWKINFIARERDI